MLTISCATKFDITPTGIKGHQRQSILPCQDLLGKIIDTNHEWMKARNQQRNWETLNQIIGLRTLPSNFTAVHVNNSWWQFSFDIEHASHVAWGADPLGALRYDCKNIPMIIGLEERRGLVAILEPYTDDPNIVFEIKTS